jgi:predicted aspartyl protease
MNAFAITLAIAVTVGTLAAGTGPTLADASCQLVRITSLGMQTDEAGGVYVPMTIAGENANLLIDTGGIVSMLTQSTVKSLSLSTEAVEGVRIVMFGGTPITRYTTAHDIDFGGLKAAHMDFLIVPDGRLPPELNGTLAPDILRAYDDDFDFANAKFTLFSQDHCAGNLAYWTHDPHAEIPFRVDSAGHINFPVTLDGKDVRATLDTGASRSVLGLEAAEDTFSFDEKNASLKVLGTTRSGHSYKFPFNTLLFGEAGAVLGSVTVINPDLILVSRSDSRLPGSPDLILGMGVLRQLHLYIDYKEKKLYVTAASAH